VPAATGRPGEAPGALWQRSLYGARYRLRSRRRLEQATHRKVALRWRLQKRRPAHKTIADCRKHTLQPLRQGCRPFTRRGKQRDRCGADLVAIDGRTCSAVHAKERHCTPAKLQRLLAQIDERLDASLKALARADTQAEAGTSGGAGAANGQAQIAALPHRRLREAGLQAQ
jgi:transposase